MGDEIQRRINVQKKKSREIVSMASGPTRDTKIEREKRGEIIL
jgi:hypothetical protein